MLRRRLLMVAEKIVRIYGKVKVVTYSKVGTMAASIPAILAKLESGVANSLKLNSMSYDASTSNIEVSAAVEPSLDAVEYDANLVNENVLVTIEQNIEPQAIVISNAELNGQALINKLTNADSADGKPGIYDGLVKNDVSMEAQDCESRLGDSKKIININSIMNAFSSSRSNAFIKKKIQIDSLANAESGAAIPLEIKVTQKIKNKVEPLSGNVQFVNLAVLTSDKAIIDAVAGDVINSQINASEGVEVYISIDSADTVDANLDAHVAESINVKPDAAISMNVNVDANVANDVYVNADIVNASLSLLNTHKANTQVSVGAQDYNAVDGNYKLKGSMIVTFAPVAKAAEWLEPILIDGRLLIRQAYGINQNNNTLEVI